MNRYKKVLIILHLCLAFSYFSWLLIQPYAKQLLFKKSEIAIYQAVIGSEKLFNQLPLEEQAVLTTGYSASLHKNTPSWFQACARSVAYETQPFALAWLFFSLLIALFLLLQIEGAQFTAWILPITALAYSYFIYDTPSKKSESLFPSEEYVLTTYAENIQNKAVGQRDRLQLGWHRYLVTEWAHELPSENPESFKEQMEKGLFAFNVARLKWLAQGKGDMVILAGLTPLPSLLRLGCYFIWNLVFAWVINRKEKHISAAAPSITNCLIQQ